MNLPTFLVGLGRPPVEDGLAVDQSSTTTTSLTDSMGYNSYLSDARNAVRAKFEATQCWVYDYDGISPPPFPPKSDSQVSSAIKLFFVAEAEAEYDQARVFAPGQAFSASCISCSKVRNQPYKEALNVIHK
jgi:hypothetical protein